MKAAASDKSGLTSNVHRGWIGLAPIAAAFVAAIALTPTREDQAVVSRS